MRPAPRNQRVQDQSLPSAPGSFHDLLDGVLGENDSRGPTERDAGLCPSLVQPHGPLPTRRIGGLKNVVPDAFVFHFHNPRLQGRYPGSEFGRRLVKLWPALDRSTLAGTSLRRMNSPWLDFVICSICGEMPGSSIK